MFHLNNALQCEATKDKQQLRYQRYKRKSGCKNLHQEEL